MCHAIKKSIFILSLAASNFIAAQTNSPQYNFKQLNIQNGLTQNIVYHFLQDSKGYMWIGTRNGLTRYDGVSTVNFLHDEERPKSLASNFITRILEDSAHQLWIGNVKGIDLFNRSNNDFIHYGIHRSGGEEDDSYCVPLAFVSATEFWFIDTKEKSIRAFDTRTKSSSFICGLDAAEGTIYISPKNNDVHFWSYQSNGTVHLVFQHKKLIQQQFFFSGRADDLNHAPLQVFHVLQQNDSTTWLSTNKGLICLDATTNRYVVYDNWKAKPVSELRFAALLTDGILWLASGPAGIYIFDTNKRTFTANYQHNRSDPFSICSNNIVSLYFDKANNVWCGSYGNGASYAGIGNILFTKHIPDLPEKANNIFWAGLDKSENCWCILSDESGFWVFDKSFENCEHIIPVKEDGQFFRDPVYRLAFDDNGNAWCATAKGLYLYNRKSNRIRQVHYPLLSDLLFGSNWLNDIVRLRDGSFIFSTFSGLYSIKKENGKSSITLFSSLNEMPDKKFDLIFEDEARNIYVKGNDDLYIFKKNTDSAPALIKAISFPAVIYQYFSDSIQQVLYIAANDGLYVLDKKNFSLRKETIDPPMPFQSISSVFEKDKKLWLFGEKGLYYFDQQHKQGRTFTVEDGLPANEFNVSAITFSKEGKCVVGTTNGLVSFYPGSLLRDLYPPRAQLDHIYVNDVLYKKTNEPNETNKISLTYQQNTFAFDFAAIAFQHNTACRYEYRLEGYDEDWVKSENKPYTRYSKIPPGEYTFQLRVYDVNGILSPFTKSLQIDIAKPFWQTGLFRFAMLLVILCIGWLLFRWYIAGKMKKQQILIEKQRAVEQERTRIAMEMHDDLGSGLTAIRYLAGSLSGQSAPATQRNADKIAGAAQTLVESMNDIIWSMKSDGNTAGEVLAYIRKQVAELLENADIDYSFDFPENIPEIKLSSEQKRNLLLISKEAIHNIIKHSHAGKVWMTATFNSNSMQLIIKDNGKGFEPELASPLGNGVKNMHRRAADMNAQLIILNSAGTTIHVTLPFG